MERFSKSTRKVIRAVLIGPLAVIPATIFAICMMLLFGVIPFDNAAVTDLLGAAALISLFGVLYGYGATLVYGLPALIILKKLHWDNFVAIVVVALIPTIVLSVHKLLVHGVIDLFIMIGYYSLAVGISCWWLAKSGQDNGSNKQRNADSGADAPPPVN